MEADGIGAVLSRASDLRSKISNCIDKATSREKDQASRAEADDEAESLFNIRDALESLEEQLTSLQALQQQQQFERETTLSEIDHSRRFLLKKLKEYKGEELEVIREASAFAGDTIDHDEALLLPPYPNPPVSLILDETYSSPLHRVRNKSARNGTSSGKEGKSAHELDKLGQPSKKNFLRGLINIVGWATKTVFTLVGVVTVVRITGFEARIRERSIFKVAEVFQKPGIERQVGIECPPGKVLVVDDGKPRCLVKGRVEVPFEPVVATPDVKYGCG